MARFLVTGGAGFIGSRICEMLVEEGHFVRCLDNLSSGKLQNLKDIISYPNFEFINGDIRDLNTCINNSNGMDYIIHQAALVSVPMSIEKPIENNNINVSGFVNILEAARINNIKKVIYASSSAVYGDNLDKEKVEDNIGNSISPYALSKRMDEQYADLYYRVYNIESVGLRYFNVYGPKQDPSSEYSGVISIFMKRLIEFQDLNIYGDGSIVRDFVYVDDVARANILAVKTKTSGATVYNIGTNTQTSILQLAKILINVTRRNVNINFLPPRKGDILYSLANIDKAKKDLKFKPTIDLKTGLNMIYKELSNNKWKDII